MKILMADTALNRQASESLGKISQQQIYPEVDLQACGEELSIIDLEADGSFQDLFSPEALVDFLLKNGLNHELKVINLLVSDVSHKDNLICYATELTKILADRGYRVSVRVPTELNYAATLLCPPAKSEQPWQVYGIPQQSYPQLMQSAKQITTELNGEHYQLYATCQGKKLLHKGDVLDWLKNPDRVLESTMNKFFKLQP